MGNTPKLVGTAISPVKIDESYVCGKRKYGKGRLLVGDRAQSNKIEDIGFDLYQPDDSCGAKE